MANQPDPRGPLLAILDRLNKVRQHGNYWTAQCPAHEDRNPSLSVTEGSDGRVLLNCHAGCTTQSVVSALGLTESDLFPPREQTRREISSYRYEDEAGVHLYDVVRFEPKDFRQRRANGTWGLGDTRRVLYKLPKVRAAIQAGETVYVVEGEKDVHAIERVGATATCNPMGAGKWRNEYTEQLHGAPHIIIVADTDTPGIAHAEQIAQQLETAGITHRIVVPASGKDATDHLAAGHTLQDLVPRIPKAEQTEASPIIIETWREFANKASQEIPCLIERLWPKGSLGFIASPPKKGKTWIGLSLALSVATANTCLGTFDVPQQQTVLYVALEGHRAALTHRIGCLARGFGINPDNPIEHLHLTYKPRGINIAEPSWAEHLANAADRLGAQLVIVDVLRAAALIKENSAEDFAALRANLTPLLHNDRSLAFLHHFTKLNENTKERTPAERMSGSGAMYGALDIGIFITGSENGSRTLRLDFDARDIAAPERLGLHLEGTGTGLNGGFNYNDKAWWTVTDSPDEDDVKAPAREIHRWLTEHGGEEREDLIALAFDVSAKTIARRRTVLQENFGIEVVTKRGEHTRYRIKQRTTDTTDMSNGQTELV